MIVSKSCSRDAGDTSSSTSSSAGGCSSSNTNGDWIYTETYPSEITAPRKSSREAGASRTFRFVSPSIFAAIIQQIMPMLPYNVNWFRAFTCFHLSQCSTCSHLHVEMLESKSYQPARMYVHLIWLYLPQRRTASPFSSPGLLPGRKSPLWPLSCFQTSLTWLSEHLPPLL